VSASLEGTLETAFWKAELVFLMMKIDVRRIGTYTAEYLFFCRSF
jgi:hypothetical protein